MVVGERPNDPAHDLFAVRSPFLLSDGGLGVPLSRDAAIRIYDANGELVNTLGSEGQGPGEFLDLATAWARGDTVEAFDPELNRITRFAPGAPPEPITLQPVASAQSAAPGLDDGTWVLYGLQEVRPSGRDVIAVHRFGPDGTHLGKLEEMEGFRRHAFPGGGGPDPISPRAIIRASGQAVYAAETLSARIAVTDVVRAETAVVEWTVDGELSGKEAAELARDALAASGIPEGQRNWHVASFDALSGEEDAPVFWDFLVDGSEFLWIRGYDPSLHSAPVGGLGRTGPGGVWSVLDRSGTKLGEISLPSDFEPYGIDGDLVIGIRRDDMDVESVRVYGIERSGGQDG